jgi:hypothetical protein
MEIRDVLIEKARAIAGEVAVIVEARAIEPYSHDEFATDEFAREPRMKRRSS